MLGLGVKAILLDLDGTITRFNLDYIGARREVIREIDRLGLKNSEITEEMSVYLMLKKLRSKVREEDFLCIKRSFYAIVERMEAEAAEKVELLPGAKQAIVKLKELGLRLALVTNNSRRGTERTLQRHSLSNLFDVIVTRDDSDELKPDAGLFREALRRLGLQEGDAMVVGDTVIDIQAAKAAGILSVAVTTGLAAKKNLAAEGPDYLIASINDLPELLTREMCLRS